MKMTDQRQIQADPATVYAALLDPAVLKECVPGAQEVEGNPTDGYTAKVVQKVGPVKATFTGQVTMSDLVENEKLTIQGEGKGGAAGFAKGGADVTLSATEDGGTLLTYDVEANVGGNRIHSGSRALGHQVGTDYLQVLDAASRKYGIPIRERELVGAHGAEVGLGGGEVVQVHQAGAAGLEGNHEAGRVTPQKLVRGLPCVQPLRRLHAAVGMPAEALPRGQRQRRPHLPARRARGHRRHRRRASGPARR